MSPSSSRKREVFLDVGPLFEEHWTGIPIVTARLAEHGLRKPSRQWRFLYNNQEVQGTSPGVSTRENNHLALNR